MSKICLLLSVVFLIQVSRACDENNNEQLAERRDSIEYLANAYGFAPNQWDPYYYQSNARVPDYTNSYEGRAAPRPQFNNPFKSYFNKNNVNEANDVENRFAITSLGQSLINAGLFNNRFSSSGTTFRPFAGLANRLPITLNPNYASPLSTFDACTSPSGESGICSPGAVCSLFGGRPSGSCLLGGVCCINAVTTCGGSVTLNNTYWQSPTTAVSSSSTCSLTVKLDTKLVEQKKPICQVRLDFISFSTAQPDATTGVCSDVFRAGGALNAGPDICGENTGQHMYLEVPSSATNPTDLQLMFNFGTTSVTRSWNIKIAMLPCGASYLAPTDCLQYFTATSGRVTSFNWQNIAVATTGVTRQLAGQNYNICFRTELIDKQRAGQVCLKQCTGTVQAGNAFGLSGATAAAVSNSAALAASCLADYLLIPNGGDGTNVADRFCGNNLNPAVAPATTITTVCTPVKPFRISYKTDGTEADGTNNVGFCLSFQQQQ